MGMIRKAALVGASVAMVGAALLTPALTATATAAPTITTIADGFAGPLQFAVGTDGTLYVAQDFSAVLTTIDKKGGRVDIASTPGGEIAGVDALGKGTATYTTSGDNNGTPFALVRRVLPNGQTSTIGDVGTYEAQVNPDQVNSYGFQDLTPACAAKVPSEIGGEPYNGIVDSHPYSVAIMGGSRYVADAAGNDIVRVDPNGRVTTVAVLPPQPTVVTAAVARANGLPPCTVGHVYNFEPVPTDVEVGPRGMLYVSTLPGGPEDQSLGARGSVYRIDPSSGSVTRVATGFVGATNVAVTPDGTIYVAELFADRISRVSGGGGVPVVSLHEPAAVEWANGKLYASTDVFGNGAIVTITP